ncbi:hypothetical protein PV328_006341 [Microctonus aethiopoides]|uniref:Chitin-binding type-2 domain-containing protein n=1 Tax=Microctonus aethiopoides TaxID=144406 RepID=A0AA39KTF5_9HYME|nr:hypothetical protein PV328_006341 [Microctonus aethiopoides]
MGCKCAKYRNVFLFLSKWNEVATSNATETDLEDDDADDEELEKMNFEQFKRTIKRYRRLIPYTSYYISNNYVNNPGQLPLSYTEEQTLASQPSIVNIDGQLGHKRQSDKLKNSFIHQSTSLDKQQKFIPSVQYDPKNIGGDNDYFTPVRYNNKVNYDDYYRDYDRRPSNYHEITTPKAQTIRYYTKERSSTQKIPYAQLYERDHQKQSTHIQPEYLINYIPRPKPTPQSNPDYYPVDDFESLRYVKIKPPPPPPPIYHQPSRVIPSIKRRPNYQQHNPIVNDDNIAKSLELTNQLPEVLNKDNIDSSIKTLVEILSLLHSAKSPSVPQRFGPTSTPAPNSFLVSQNIPNYEEFNAPQKYTRPKVVTETRYQATTTPVPILINDKPSRFKVSVKYTNNVKSNAPELDYNDGIDVKNHDIIEYYTPLVQDIDEIRNAASYTAVTETNIVEVSQEHSYEINEDVDEENEKPQTMGNPQPEKHHQLAGGFINAALTIPNMSIKYGVTQGRPDTDYPIYSVIPETNFNCKAQRYKGFFGDPSTRCQVWHYCDLNGGKSSFLCPNGTIFSQAALTCDWWFNVKCEATTQLYVLNERLYKFILPIMPKFPEDFSGPEVDQYLELKFKEMEAKLKAKKLKKAMEKKMKEKQPPNNEE